MFKNISNTTHRYNGSKTKWEKKTTDTPKQEKLSPKTAPNTEKKSKLNHQPKKKTAWKKKNTYPPKRDYFLLSTHRQNFKHQKIKCKQTNHINAKLSV